MIQLGYLRAALLGLIQGLTEFLPISSSGHLALVQRHLHFEPSSPQMLLFNVVVHVGTLLAVVIVFWRSASRFSGRLVRELRGDWAGRRVATRIALLAVLATIPTAVIGLVFKDTFESAFGKPAWIGLCLFVTGVLLVASAVRTRGRRGWKRFAGWQAVLIGAAQSLAILPGLSRSGSTICVAMLLGIRRRWAAEFSFLIAMPAIAGAAVLKIRDTLALPGELLDQVQWGPILLGGAVALGVGVAALRLLLDTVRRAKLHYFALYCWLLGGYILATG